MRPTEWLLHRDAEQSSESQHLDICGIVARVCDRPHALVVIKARESVEFYEAQGEVLFSYPCSHAFLIITKQLIDVEGVNS